MKKRIMLSGILFIIIIISVLVYFNKNNNDLENVLQNKKYNETISMMLETASGSGEYEKTTASGWPTDGYIFNTELSRCEKGSTLSWDDENNKVVMSGNVSDKCYVYFDKVVKATINEMTTSDVTDTSITITINATKGTYDISKYYYSVDNGVTWNESANNKIVISNLTQDTKYTLKVYVQDVKGLNSEVKSITATTIKLISFTINDTEYKAIEGMTWGKWVNSEYNIEKKYGLECEKINGNVIFKLNNGGYYVSETSIGILLNGNDIIIANGSYTHQTSGIPEKTKC